MTITEGSERLAKALLLPINPALVIILGIFTIVWGLWVLNPFHAMYTTTTYYSTMAALAPEWFFGLFAICCGAVTCYGAVKRRYAHLVRGAITSCFHWSVVATLFFWADFFATGGITALVFAIYAGVVALNIRANFKDDKNSPQILH